MSMPACRCPLECLQFVPLFLQFATLFAEGTLQDLSMSAFICAFTPRIKSKVEKLGTHLQAA